MFEVLSGSQYPQKVIPLIDGSKNKIEIVVFDWRWYGADPASNVQLFNQSIIRATRRGVVVRAITNCPDIITTLNRNGVIAKKLISKKLLHTKLMIIDEKQIVIGSHNFSMSAFNMNAELSVILTPEKDIEYFIDYFQNLWIQT